MIKTKRDKMIKQIDVCIRNFRRCVRNHKWMQAKEWHKEALNYMNKITYK
jgi:hypothetical protein